MERFLRIITLKRYKNRVGSSLYLQIMWFKARSQRCAKREDAEGAFCKQGCWEEWELNIEWSKLPGTRQRIPTAWDRKNEGCAWPQFFPWERYTLAHFSEQGFVDKGKVEGFTCVFLSSCLIEQPNFNLYITCHPTLQLLHCYFTTNCWRQHLFLEQADYSAKLRTYGIQCHEMHPQLKLDVLNLEYAPTIKNRRSKYSICIHNKNRCSKYRICIHN